MRILFNIIFSAILAIGLVGFWTLFLNLWKPKKKWPAWVGYIIIIGVRGYPILYTQSSGFIWYDVLSFDEYVPY